MSKFTDEQGELICPNCGGYIPTRSENGRFIDRCEACGGHVLYTRKNGEIINALFITPAEAETALTFTEPEDMIRSAK